MCWEEEVGMEWSKMRGRIHSLKVRKVVEQHRARHGSWNKRGTTSGLRGGWYEKTCWAVVKYKWKMKQMELRLWVGSRTPVWVLRWAWGLCLAAGYRMGWNRGRWWGREIGRQAGKLLQESAPQRGGSGDTNRNVKSSIKSAFRGQNDTFVMENAVQRREKDDLYKWPWAPHHNITPNNHVSNTDSWLYAKS